MGIIGDSLLAREPGISREKAFKLMRIASVIHPDGRTVENDGAESIKIETSATPLLASLAEYVAMLKTQYVAAGWNVFEAEQLFGVGRFLKSGKPRKYPCISVEFMDRTEVETLDFETGELVTEKRALTGRERPWCVQSDRQPRCRSFSELHKAIEYFTTEISASSPHK
ncbi:hypothetical protein UC35_14960 [Ramlibacter tataouinensis]|uniref:Uncharacterized protein n=1 Tax=Ramlibacter tataouinensis TaxID=94132 RepID=A0A127JVJ7_9BURK|nr:hypothetical protein UC35_14960 [Ramlibacter tataouinensis]